MITYKQLIKRHKIKLIFLQFCDMLGEIKGIYIPINKLNDAIKNGISFDGSSIKGYGSVKSSDKIFFVDTKRYYLLPNNILSFFCYINYNFDARNNLKKICKKLKNLGYKIQVGAEIEFFLFDQKNNKPNLRNLERVGYFSEINIKKLNALNEIVDLLNKQNFEVEAVHHEGGKNQYELDFLFGDALEIADKVIIAKQVIKQIAKKHKLYASFMPKPLQNIAGSGMHINLSVVQNEKNIFFDANKKYKLSNFAVNFASNVANHIGAICAFSNQNINSYKRLNAHIETPTKVKLGYKDRLSAFRIPDFNEKNARIEFRFPDIACHIYLTLCAIILSGFEQILSTKKITYSKIKTLPKSLNESLEYLKNDKYISKLVPKSFFMEIQKEIQEYENQITPYEIKKYV